MATMNIHEIQTPPTVKPVDRWVYWVSQHWIIVFGVLYGAFVGLPFLAPVLMKVGWDLPGKAIYFIFSFLCHQLPERSYFLFGPNVSVTLPEIQAAWQNTTNPLILRQFTGTPMLGWKVAWSDRMVSLYTSIWLFGILWWLVRRKVCKLPWWGWLLFALPMVIDGGTHFVSDFAGIGQGFRDSNAWLAVLTQNAFSSSFYAGDAWYSFNGIARLLTGVLFGLGIVWFGFPYLDEVFQSTVMGMQYRWQWQAERLQIRNQLIAKRESTNLETRE